MNALEKLIERHKSEGTLDAAAYLAQLRNHITDLEEQAKVYKGAREVIDEFRLENEEARRVIAFVIEDSIIIEKGYDACENCKHHAAAFLAKYPQEEKP